MLASFDIKKSTNQQPMIKNSTYIRSFTITQRLQMERVQSKNKLKTVPDILFFCLDNYLDQLKEIARLNRIIEYKQKKIDNLIETPYASI